MSVYNWLVILLLATALFLGGNIKGNKRFILVAFILLFAVMGLRDVYTGGIDAAGANGSYPVIFQYAGSTSWGALVGRGEDNYNFGFLFLTKLLYNVTDGNYQSYISILSFFFLISYLRFILKYSPSPIQSILYFLGLLYYVLLFDILKQAFAMSILLFAFDAIIEKKPLRFVLLVLFAAQFHYPALIFLPAYWVGRMRISRSFLYLLAILLIVTYFLRDQILNLMLDAYGGDEIEATMEGVRFLRNKALVMVVIVIAASVLRPPSEGDAVYNACLVFAGIAIVFQTFCGYNNIFERLADYYFHTSIVLLPLVFEKCEQKTHVINLRDEMSIKTFAPWAFSAFAIWRFLSYVNNSYSFYSYRFLWQ